MIQRPPLYSPIASPTANWYRASQVEPLLDRLERYEAALQDIAGGDETSTVAGAIAIAKIALENE